MTTHIPEFKLKAPNRQGISFKLDKLATHSGYNSGAPHRHNHYEIFFFSEGGGVHMIDFQEVGICKGHIHLLSPGQVHYMHREPGSSGWVLKFTPEFFLSAAFASQKSLHISLLTQGLAAPLICPEAKDFELFLRIVDQIREEYQNKESDFEEMILHYLHVILLKCSRLQSFTNNSVGSADRTLYQAFQRLLEQYFQEQNRVTFYSEQLHVSSDKLNYAIKSVSGSSPSEMISTRLLLEAKRWLLYSEKSVKEIAYQLNFQDHAYFNRWFKKHENQSPGAFRRYIREKYHA
jgi:AraC-like DNA-binding protein